jgi:pimeloyl-ACP methyl ester carboxylesterase
VTLNAPHGRSLGLLRCLAAAGLIAGCEHEPQSGSEPCTKVDGAHQVFAAGPCPASVPDDAQLTCGTLELAEAPDAERSCKVSLAWVRYDPLEPSEDPPIFVLGGGPAGVLVERSAEVLVLARRVAPGRSWVIHDVRGVGESSPRLDCRGTSGQRGDVLSGLRACGRAYRAAGHDPTRYRTEALAADVDALAEAFGAEQIDIFGASYGSRLGYAFGSLYPDRARALVLDGAVPLDAPLFERPVGSYLQAMSRILDDCAAAESCARWHGDVAAAHAANLERLADDPPRVDYEGNDLPLSPQVYVALTGQLAASAFARMVPAFVRAIADGDLAPAEAALADLPGSAISTYVYHAIMCSEELPQNDRNRALADLAQLPAYASVPSLDAIAAQCEALGLAPAPGAMPAWRSSVRALDDDALPVLALSGRYDPLSVASNWLDSDVDVPAGSLFVMPDASHAARNSACGSALITRFLAEPQNGLELPADCSAAPDFFAQHFALDAP